MAPNAGKKVVVAMSGGVDSAVAAALLQRDGYDVVGCFMRLGSDDSAEAADGYDNLHVSACDPKHGSGGGQTSQRSGRNSKRSEPAAAGDAAGAANPKAESGNPKSHKQGCCSLNDAADARLVAAKLDVPLYVLNFKPEFGRIIDYFVGEYNAGRTPNPCVRCNDWLKFGKLYQYAMSIDADYIASGHHARIERVPRPTDSDPHATQARLRRGVDAGKDQSYVLFGSPRERLERMLLPIGGYHKDEVRALAEQFDLPVSTKPDSQEICFVPDNDYARLVERRTPDEVNEGEIRDTSGNMLGTHPGHQHFTIGQRRGIGVALGYPIYVTHRDPAGNTITVGQKDDLLATGCTARETNWLIDDVPRDWRRCDVKVRYNSAPVPGWVRATGDEALAVHFDEPISAVTPGQAVVCYEHAADVVLGGGWIEAAHDVSQDA